VEEFCCLEAHIVVVLLKAGFEDSSESLLRFACATDIRHCVACLRFAYEAECVLEHHGALRKGGMKEEEGVGDFAGAPFANVW
jgi:hypothetical protein